MEGSPIIFFSECKFLMEGFFLFLVMVRAIIPFFLETLSFSLAF